MRGNTGGAVVRSGDLGVVSANGVKAWWSSCGVPEIGENFEGKKAEGRLVAEGGGEKVLQGVGKQPLQTYLDRRQAKLAEWFPA